MPYYGIPPGNAVVGHSLMGGTDNATASMTDEPNRGDDSYFVDPADATKNVVTLAIHFDVNVFCAKGDAAGTWLGNIKWDWKRDKGSAVTTGDITLPSATGDTSVQPSADFLATIPAWIAKNPGFVLPVGKFKGCN